MIIDKIKKRENNISEDWTIGEYYTQTEDQKLPKGTILKVDEGDIHSNNITFDYK